MTTGSWILSVAALCFIGLAVAQVFSKKRPRKRILVPSDLQGINGHDWLRLLNMCNGDKAAAKRMIKLEQKKNPKLSIKKACQNAIDRHKRG